MIALTEKAGWQIEDTPEGRCIKLSGHWNLLAKGQEKRRIARQLQSLPQPRQLIWDLEGIEALDSTGTLLLWHTWGDNFPKELRCRPDQRRWFERLSNLPPFTTPPPWRPWHSITRLGEQLTAIAGDVWGVLLLVGRLMLDLAYTVAHPRLIPWKEISAGIYKIGASALILLGAIGFLIGMVMTYQLATSLQRFGANTMIVNLLGLSMMRELGPVATALIVMGRSGSAITAGIGAMHLTEELDALRAFGSSPTQRLVLPKVIAMALSIPLLVVWTDFVGILGGMIVSDVSLGVKYQLFMVRLVETVPWVNFWIGMGKGFIFGMIIATLASYFGLKIQANTESLSQQTTNSVVTGLTLIIVIDALAGVLLTNVGLYT
jgi:phospholipid/cholesterol/gamma-HCH transport system permease protein